jgi:hypothetical protein
MTQRLDSHLHSTRFRCTLCHRAVKKVYAKEVDLTSWVSVVNPTLLHWILLRYCALSHYYKSIVQRASAAI